jgi:hypothetical protein
MRIGIMTFWESQNNYGQLLQAYALQSYLENKGHEVFLIKYRRIRAKKNSILKRLISLDIKRFIKDIIEKKNALAEKINNPRDFNSFRSSYLHFTERVYNSFEDLKSNPPEADMYVCGSDQVWNNTFKVSCEAFLLGFGEPNKKRVAYAASFGTKEISENTRRLFETHIKKFNGVSVREESGIDLCKHVGYKDPYWLPDPTLLFSSEQWLSMVPPRNVLPSKRNKRLFLYTLGNSKIPNREAYIQYAKSLHDVEVIHVSANGDYSGNEFPAIDQWLSIINSSDYVITNSFHGIVFSIIFNKNFIVLPNTGSALGMNERILSLLGKLKLTDHIIYHFDEKRIDELLNMNILWNEVNLCIKDWQNDANIFWLKHLC